MRIVDLVSCTIRINTPIHRIRKMQKYFSTVQERLMKVIKMLTFSMQIIQIVECSKLKRKCKRIINVTSSKSITKFFLHKLAPNVGS